MTTEYETWYPPGRNSVVQALTLAAAYATPDKALEVWEKARAHLADYPEALRTHARTGAVLRAWKYERDRLG